MVMKNQSESKKGKSKRSGTHDRKSIRLKGYDYSKAGLYFVTLCCQDRKHRFGTIENGEMILNENGKIAHDEWFKLSERFPNMELDEFQIMPNHIHFIVELTVGSTLPVDATEIPSVDPAEIRVGSTLAVDPAEIPSVDPTETSSVDPAEIPSVDPTETSSVDPAEIPSVDPTEMLLIDLENLILNDSSETWAGPSTVPTIVGDIVGAYKSLVFNGCLALYKNRNQQMGKFWQRNYYEHIIRDEKAYHIISNYIKNNPKKWGKDKFYKK
jgi:REP element-mobilizing transposase RayT